MDRELKRIEEDLRGVVAGEVLCDAASRGLYATDAGLVEAWPLAVVRPRSAEDVAATVTWAAGRGIAVHARGAGSSLAGGALGPGVVVDCSRFLRRIVNTGADTVRVQPGVVAAQLEEHLARTGRLFGPDPSGAWVTTIGGMIGRNSSGSRLPRHGDVRSRIVSAETVLADGSLVELAATPATAAGSRAAELASGVAAVLAASRAEIAAGQPAGRTGHGGYRLDDVERDGVVDLARLLGGAEGTLGIVTEVTLRTVPDDRATAVGLLLFDSLDHAAEAAVRLRPLAPDACDLFDKRHLALARTARAAFEQIVPAVADAGLLVEFSAADAETAADRFDAAAAGFTLARGRCLDVRRAETRAEADLLWELSRNVVPTLHGVRGAVRPVPFVEDVLLPPEAVPAFVRRLQEVLRQCDATAMLFAHAGHGQLHVRPYADPRAPGERERLERLADALYREVVAAGGTIGGEQGLGLSRTAFFAAHYPELAGVFAAVKRVFDPAGILNPGRIVPAVAPPPEWRGPLAAAAAPAGAAADAPVATAPDTETGGGTTAAAGDAEKLVARAAALSPLPVLSWTAPRLAAEVDACNGCGACRTLSPAVRMCPIYREQPAEEAAPRAKANLVAAVLSGRLDPKALAEDAARKIADTCVNCHQCRTGCAAGVDIPALVSEIKAAHVRANGLAAADWLLSRVDTLSALGGAVAPLANRALASPQARWVMEKLLGIARGRKLPRFTGQQVMRWAARRGLTKPSRRSGPRVLYFLDTFARRHDPLLVRALVAVLEHNRVGVFIDPRQLAAGMPLMSAGDVDAARRVARANVRVLAEAVRLGYRIVSTEPAAVTSLVHDYPLLLDDDEVAGVAAATTDAASYLWELHGEGRLKGDFSPVGLVRADGGPARLLYHAPCHARIGRDTSPAEHLLRLVPGLALEAADRGCSGMAGTFGLSRRHYRTSLRAGLGLVSALRSAGIAAGATECSACRIQMEQGTRKPTVHPVKLLAKAYGLLEGAGPDGLDTLLTTPSGQLTTS
jgi:FAD/FMN-containing dehydrogenase/Fe-S oxidoreductase